MVGNIFFAVIDPSKTAKKIITHHHITFLMVKNFFASAYDDG